MICDQIKRVINLHPTTNSGEAATAIVYFLDRHLNLILKFQSYGNHWADVSINFDSPKDMLSLSDTLKEVALFAQEYYKTNP